jgi:hypothetical protein
MASIQGSVEDYITGSFMIYTTRQMFFGWSNRVELYGRRMWHVWGTGQVRAVLGGET